MLLYVSLCVGAIVSRNKVFSLLTMGFLLAYLHLTLTDSKGKGQVKVMHVSTENGQYSSNLRKTFAKISKETGLWFLFNCEC